MLQNVREFAVQILQESNERDHTLGKRDPSHQDSHVAILTMSRPTGNFHYVSIQIAKWLSPSSHIHCSSRYSIPVGCAMDQEWKVVEGRERKSTTSLEKADVDVRENMNEEERMG